MVTLDGEHMRWQVGHRIDLPRDQLNFLVVKDAAGHHSVELSDVESVTSLGAVKSAIMGKILQSEDSRTSLQ